MSSLIDNAEDELKDACRKIKNMNFDHMNKEELITELVLTKCCMTNTINTLEDWWHQSKGGIYDMAGS